MNLALWVVIGILMGAGSASWLAHKRSNSFIAITFIAFIYVGFALYGDPAATLTEILVATAFTALCLSLYAAPHWVYIAAALLIAHGAYDLLHHQLVANAGVPSWYGPFCAGFDFSCAAVMVFWHRRPA